jgi:hypothetical protein
MSATAVTSRLRMVRIRSRTALKGGQFLVQVAARTKETANNADHYYYQQATAPPFEIEANWKAAGKGAGSVIVVPPGGVWTPTPAVTSVPVDIAPAAILWGQPIPQIDKKTGFYMWNPSTQ